MSQRLNLWRSNAVYCICIHTCIYCKRLCIPVMNEPFTDKKKKSGERVNHALEDLATADCESSSSHDWPPCENRSLHVTLTDRPWSVSICWNSRVVFTGINILTLETRVEDLTELQGDPEVGEQLGASGSQVCEEPMWLLRVLLLCHMLLVYTVHTVVFFLCTYVPEETLCWNKIEQFSHLCTRTWTVPHDGISWMCEM